MRKFLLSIFASLFALTAFSVEKVDTLFFQPGETGNVLMELDTVKYPYLTEDNVSWFIGFPEVLAHFTVNGAVVDAKVCALNISESPMFSSLIITGADGKKYLHSEEIGENWFPIEGMASHPRTITLFNAHQVQATKSVNDGIGIWYDKNDLATSICDTVAVLHILKELDKKDVKSFVLNETNAKEYDIHEGDTLKASVTLNTESLDVKEYILASVEGEDTTALVVSETPDFYFIPEQSYEKLLLIVSNDMGYVAMDGTWEKKLNFIPKFKVEGVSYTRVFDGESYTKELLDVKGVKLEANEGDSISLNVVSNYKQSEASLTFTWNKDGAKLPESDSIYVENKGLTLSFGSFKTATMNGVYNCIIADKKSGKQIETVSFGINASLTANEEIQVVDNSIRVFNNTLYLEGVEGNVYVYSMVGKLMKTVYANGGINQYSLNLSNGIYLVVNGDKTVKVVIK